MNRCTPFPRQAGVVDRRQGIAMRWIMKASMVALAVIVLLQVSVAAPAWAQAELPLCHGYALRGEHATLAVGVLPHGDGATATIAWQFTPQRGLGNSWIGGHGHFKATTAISLPAMSTPDWGTQFGLSAGRATVASEPVPIASGEVFDFRATYVDPDGVAKPPMQGRCVYRNQQDQPLPQVQVQPQSQREDPGTAGPSLWERTVQTVGNAMQQSQRRVDDTPTEVLRTEGGAMGIGVQKYVVRFRDGREATYDARGRRVAGTGPAAVEPLTLMSLPRSGQLGPVVAPRGAPPVLVVP
jgi:hypothetical protein